jgi:hypothetical protein
MRRDRSIVNRYEKNVIYHRLTRVCTVYIVNERIGSPTFCGSSTDMTKTGGIPLSFFCKEGMESSCPCANSELGSLQK